MNKKIIATATPLASIFGSGFLVIIPILSGAVGYYSPIAMLIVCLIAYAVGSVIRFNIKHAEPILKNSPPESTLSFERASDFALILAYVISVCLYLRILSAFVLGGLNIDSPLNESLLTSSIIVMITLIGITKGLEVLENLELWSLSVTMVIILIMISGFAYYDYTIPKIILPNAIDHTTWEVLTIIAGTLIVVQGFETPRYLGDIFDTQTRIDASRNAQIISTIVYIIFVSLSVPIIHTLNGQYDDNSLIKLVAEVSTLLITPLIIAAALSQFSAAVADTLTATGNMEEITHGGLKVKWAYLFIGMGAIALSWTANTYQIIALASRAFAFYYLLQCFVAISIAKTPTHRVKIGLTAIILAFIMIFAVPAS